MTKNPRRTAAAALEAEHRAFVEAGRPKRAKPAPTDTSRVREAVSIRFRLSVLDALRRHLGAEQARTGRRGVIQDAVEDAVVQWLDARGIKI